MSNWVVNRLKERTSWNGIAMIVAGIALLVSSTLVVVVAGLIILFGIVVFLWSEKTPESLLTEEIKDFRRYRYEQEQSEWRRRRD